MDTNNSSLLILLGSILTFTGTWFVESFKNTREKKERERNFKLLAKQELLIVLKTFDDLKTTLEHKNYYEVNTMSRLINSIYTLEGYKRDAIYLSSQKLQERFIDLVSGIRVYHTNIKSLQDLFWAEQKKIRDKENSIFENEDSLNRFFNENKLQYSIEHIELKRRIEEIVKELGD